MVDGRCLCGALSFSVSGALAPIQVCHCTDCQRAQGAPFATNVPVDRDRVVFSSDTATLTAYESSPGKRRWFCARCGSPVFSERDSLPGVVRLRAGLLSAPVETRVGAHMHCAASPAWWRDACTGAAPRHDGPLPAG